MPFDSFTLQAVIDELRSKIVGGRVREISQPNAYDVAFKISIGGNSEHLLISADPNSNQARSHLVHTLPKSEPNAHFANYLRNHLIRTEICQIDQVGLDRIMKISFKPSSEILETSPKAIIAEFMGKHSNIILIDEATNRILQPIKLVDEDVNRYRQLLPGLDYIPPPAQDKLNPCEINEEQFTKLIEIEDNPNQEIWKVLLNNFSGLSPALAKEIVARSKFENISLWSAWHKILSDLSQRRYQPTVVLKGDDPMAPVDVLDIFPIRPKQFPNSELVEFPTISSALERYYNAISERNWLETEKQRLTQALKRKYKSITDKLEGLSEKLQESEKAEAYRIIGELLTANLHRIKRGQDKVEVENYYEAAGEKLEILLDPLISPSQNAQQYFKRYNKAKRSKSAVMNLMAESQAILQSVSHLLDLVAAAQSRGEIESIKSQLEARALLPINLIKPRSKGRSKDKDKPTFRSYTSQNGFQIYVGRNNAENDFLTLKVASKDDMWLHAKDIPGSHVIIRNPERKSDIPMPTLLYAAKISAYFSQAKSSSHVPVDYTWVKYVSKPKGSKPGYVIYTHEKTLFVEPEKPEGKDRR